MLLNPNIRIGCSGWQYTHWRGDFCPAELAPADWLAYHAQRVETVEINHTFYRLLEASTFASWAPRAPRGFVHAVKAGCYLTHMKTLKDRSGVVSTAAAVAVNLEGLDTLLRALPRRRRHAIEFREPSWYCDEDFALP